MKGYQLTFYTQQDRTYQGKAIASWLLAEAKGQGVKGATMTIASEGIGHDGKLHSAHFFELADQPVEITMALSQQQADEFLNYLAQFKISLFYVKAPIEYGVIGE